MDRQNDGPNNEPTGREHITTVTYSSRRQAEPLMDHIRRKGTHGGVTFGQQADPCVGLLSKFATTFLELAREEARYNVQVVPHLNMPGFPSSTHNPSREVTAAQTGSNGPVSSETSTCPETSTRSGAAETAPLWTTGPRNMWLATDASVMMQIDPSTLEPIGPSRQHRLHPLLTGPLSAAHAQRDPQTGDVFNFNTAVGRVATHRVFAVRSATNTTEILAEIRDGDPVPAPPTYLHSFFLTENYVVLCLPVSRFKLGGLAIAWNKNILDSIQPFDQHALCRWFVVDRRHGRGLVARFTSPASFFFHTVNAFEQDRDGALSIFADVVEYPNHDIMHAFYYDVLRNRDAAATRFFAANPALAKDRQTTRTVQPRLTRYQLSIPTRSPPTLAATDTTILSAVGIQHIQAPHIGELPTINPLFATKPARYVYSVAARGYSAALGDAIVKTDSTSGTVLFWTGPHGHSPGECIFIPRPKNEGGTGQEDDGVVLSVVLDGVGQSSYLLCLDATDLEEVGRAECGFAVPFGFHGVHVKTD